MMRKRKLLLVEDDRLILATMAEGLRSAGYEVAEARSIEDALAVLEQFRPDLALLDIRLGAASSFDLARRLRLQDETPFMFLSAYGDDATVDEATEIGAVGFLVKPIDISQLVPGIEAGLARAADLARLRSTGRQLEHALDQQRGVSIAIGILMERHGLARDEATERLRDSARSQRKKMSDVAEIIVAAVDALALSAFPASKQ